MKFQDAVINVTNKMNCKFIKSDDSSCNAFHTQGSDYCFRHNPDFKEKATLASKNGGENRRLQGVYGKKIGLRTPNDIKSFLGMVINSVWTGKIPVQVGTSMGFLTKCWLEAYEMTDMENRIKKLEAGITDIDSQKL